MKQQITSGDGPVMQIVRLDEKTRTRLTKIVEAAGERIKLFSDVLTFASPILKDEIVYDPKAVEKRLKAPGSEPLVATLNPGR